MISAILQHVSVEGLLAIFTGIAAVVWRWRTRVDAVQEKDHERYREATKRISEGLASRDVSRSARDEFLRRKGLR